MGKYRWVRISEAIERGVCGMCVWGGGGEREGIRFRFRLRLRLRVRGRLGLGLGLHTRPFVRVGVNQSLKTHFLPRSKDR
jgi:hypothetical protein